MSSINDYYNVLYDEWGRLEKHKLELEITKRTLDEYVPEKADILDVGGGPGRYSIYLTQKGHRVTLFDLSENLVKQAEANAENHGVKLQKAICGNVLNLDTHLPDSYYDVVLCMGPMYHLLEEAERKEAIRQCLARLKPGGILIASFITVFAPLLDFMGNCPENIDEYKDWILGNFADGRNDDITGFTQAFFIDPVDVLPFFSEFGLQKLRLIAQEGLGQLVEWKLMQMPEDKFSQWIDVLYTIADHEAVYGACSHLLYVGRKMS